MEFLSDSGYIKDLAVCDLDKPMLEKLYQWARVCYYLFTVYLILWLLFI